jgi:hypothetical protein
MIRRLDRRLDRHSTRMQYGLARPPRPNDLALAVRYIKAYMRTRKCLSKLDPELFDYAARDRQRLDDERRHQFELELRSALDLIYGVR